MSSSPPPPLGSLSAIPASWVRPYTPGPLSEAQLAQYFNEGYTIVRSLLPSSLISGAARDIESLVSSVADELFAAGRITDKCEGVPWAQRVIHIEKQFPHASVLLHKRGVLPTGVGDMWASEQLIGVARQLLGPGVDIAGHPVWNLRVKTPGQEEAVVPWHQVRRRGWAGCVW